MIRVNNKDMNYVEGITFKDILKNLGYTIRNPRVTIRVDGKNIPRAARENFSIQDGMEIQIINALCGG